MNSCGTISVVFVKSESDLIFSILRAIVLDGGDPQLDRCINVCQGLLSAVLTLSLFTVILTSNEEMVW